MKRLIPILLCALLVVGLLSACTQAGETLPVSQSVGDSAEDSSAEAQEPKEPPYTPEYMTGLEQDADYPASQRITAIMINNIAACRPQRGLSDASILVESKVEGGITRFMALFDDYTKLNDVGPVRSGRDQFLRLAIPFDALYCHIGRSGITQTYIDQNDYSDRDLDGQGPNFIYRDESRLNSGYSYEHTAYTNAELLQQVIDSQGYDMDYTYSGTCFDFVNYNENGGIRELTGEAATDISIVHSNSYRTYFNYDDATGKLMMSQYSSTLGARHDTVDENTGEQLGFDNVVVLFADIYAYDYPGGNLDAEGNDKGDPDYQCVDMDFGGLGFYFSHGKVEPIRWFKGATTAMLRLTDMDENSLKVNCGTTYIGLVDLDEYNNFSYSAGQATQEEVIVDSGTDAEIGD